MSFSTLKSTKQTTKSQAHIKKNNVPTKQELKKDIRLYIQYAPDTDVRLFNLFVDLGNKFKTVYVSHKQLAKWSGFSVGTVRNSIRRLKEAGLLFTQSRGIKQTLYYKVAHHLFTSEVRYALSHLVPALQFVALTLLFTQSNCQSELLAPIKNSYLKKAKQQAITISNQRLRTKKEEKSEPRQEVFGYDPVKMGAVVMSNTILPRTFGKVLDGIKSFVPTMEQKVTLSIFPDEALLAADKRTMLKTDLQSKFKYFYAAATGYCADKKLALLRERQQFFQQALAKNLLTESDNSGYVSDQEKESGQSLGLRTSVSEPIRDLSYEQVTNLSEDERRKYFGAKSNARSNYYAELNARKKKSNAEQIAHLENP